jgi:indolepyruvate ferredoxin oxidoreductase beta subunit
MGDTKSILMVGVGGQGILLASKLLTRGLVERGYDVKMSEIHGMSQRGGSVSAHIRYGDEVHSPVIGLGAADILVSFERMETYRWLGYLKRGGKVIMNRYMLPSAPVLSGQTEYPAWLAEEVTDRADTLAIDAVELIRDLHAPRSMNMVLLGRWCGRPGWRRSTGRN